MPDIVDAATADLPAITEIYAEVVRTSTAVWTERTVTVEDRRRWMELRVAGGHPVIVARDGGEVVGYASYGDWRAWDGYRHTVEHSVYVRGSRRGAGVGRRLVEELIVRARNAEKHVMIGGIEASNEASLRLHRQLGFVEVARFSQVGVKFGRWLDLVCLQLTLEDAAAPPSAS